MPGVLPTLLPHANEVIQQSRQCLLLIQNGLPNDVSDFFAWALLMSGAAFVSRRAWQVLANVQRPSGTFASLSRRDNAWRSLRRLALACDKRWAFARLRTLHSLACCWRRYARNTKLPLSLTSQICRRILFSSVNRHAVFRAEEERAWANVRYLAQSGHS